MVNYLIVGHGNFLHIDRIIKSLDNGNSAFFVHIDKKSTQNYQSEKSNVHVLTERYVVNWGCFGLVDATISLLQKATMVSGQGYYVLLSGADYPIRSNKVIHETLSGDREYIDIEKVPSPHKPLRRVERFHFDFDRRKRNIVYFGMKLLEKIIHKIHKRKVTMDIYAGTTWFALTHNCVEHILNTLKNDASYLKVFKNSYIPDESLVHTIVGNSKFKQNIEPRVMYADWSVRPAPAVISERHIEVLKNNKHIEIETGISTPLFARKFDINNMSILKMVDSELRDD